MSEQKSLDRRSFLKIGGAATAALTLSSPALSSVLSSQKALAASPLNKWPGKVVINYNKGAYSSNTYDDARPVIIASMINDSIKYLTGETNLGAAWKAIFPSTLSAASKIAIKVPLGCADKSVAPHWSSVKAITDGLLAMDFNGAKIPATNITIYEMQCSDNFNNFDYKSGTPSNFGSIKIVRDSHNSDSADGATDSQQNNEKQEYASSLYDANFLINVFRAGSHNLEGAGGVTLGFKNHYGTYAPQPAGHSYATTYLRDINCTGAVFNKNVLSVCIGLVAAQDSTGGPGTGAANYATYAKTMDSTVTGSNVPANTIIMGTDPVSVEAQTIKMMRLNKNASYVYTAANMPNYLKSSAGITVSGLVGATQNIGVIDEANMTLLKIINSVRQTTRISQATLRAGAATAALSVARAPGHSTIVRYTAPSNQIGTEAIINVADLRGKRIAMIKERITNQTNQWTWNELDASGAKVGKGSYIFSMDIGSVQHSATVLIQ